MSLNRGFEYRERAGRSARGKTLLVHLSGSYTHSSKEQWRTRIESGEVRLDGLRAGPTTVIREGQMISWHRPPWHEPDAPLSFTILHHDRELLAVAKPAGLPTVPAGGFLEHTLLALVRRYDPGAAPMHRLGRWTSGIVLFSRGPEVRAILGEAWRAGKVRKRYHALARGRPARDRFSVNVPIGPVPHSSLGLLHAAKPEGRPALSRVLCLERREDSFLAAVVPVTGRPHQIRIHLAAAGHPLVGDPLYAVGGLPPDGCPALPGDPGYLLHASRLALRQPFSGRRIDLRCATPATLRRSK